jgi:hypothetical protein
VRASDRSCVFYLSFVLLRDGSRDNAGVPEVVGAVLITDEYKGNL